MPRLSREQLRRAEDAQRQVITLRPAPTVGGFPWIPLLTAAATPLLTSASKAIGKKLFGHGILRSGERAPFPVMTGNTRVTGSGGHHYRSGDFPMPSMMPIPHYRSNTTGGLPGAGMIKKKAPAAGSRAPRTPRV